MRRALVNYWIDIAALVSALVVFSTGLILLTRFHMGPHEADRLAGLGLSRTAWINLHRWTAVVMTVSVAVHVGMHWRIAVARVRSAFPRMPGKAPRSDPVLYFGFLVVTLAAFLAWLVLPRPLHHAAIDIHNVAGLVLLTALVRHVRRHLGWLLRRKKENSSYASQQRNLRDTRPPLVER